MKKSADTVAGAQTVSSDLQIELVKSKKRSEHLSLDSATAQKPLAGYVDTLKEKTALADAEKSGRREDLKTMRIDLASLRS